MLLQMLYENALNKEYIDSCFTRTWYVTYT